MASRARGNACTSSNTIRLPLGSGFLSRTRNSLSKKTSSLPRYSLNVSLTSLPTYLKLIIRYAGYSALANSSTIKLFPTRRAPSMSNAHSLASDSFHFLRISVILRRITIVFSLTQNILSPFDVLRNTDFSRFDVLAIRLFTLFDT